MELKIKIGYKELLELIKQLPANKIAKLKTELTSNFIEKKSEKDITSFQQFILTGPVMTDKQYEQFLTNRQVFNSWRTS